MAEWRNSDIAWLFFPGAENYRLRQAVGRTRPEEEKNRAFSASQVFFGWGSGRKFERFLHSFVFPLPEKISASEEEDGLIALACFISFCLTENIVKVKKQQSKKDLAAVSVPERSFALLL